MRKIISLVLIFIVLLNYAYAYDLTKNDIDLVNNITKNIELIIEKKGEKYRNNFTTQLKRLGIKYSKNVKFKTIINEIILSIDNNIKKDSNLIKGDFLYDYIMNGPKDEAWGCNYKEECKKKIEKDKKNGLYKNVNDIFIKETTSLYEKLKGKEGSLKNIDILAKELLTQESYNLEKTSNYAYFYKFINLFLENYKGIQNIISEYENYKPLTEEQKNLIKKEIYVDKNNDGKFDISLPDLSDSKFDFFTGHSFDFDEKGNIIFPELELEFPIILINKNRIAVNLGQWNSASIFDFLLVNGDWKIDLIEPLRPNKEKNPRIVFFDLKEKVLNTYWKGIESIAKISSLDMPVFKEFKNWWDNSSSEEKMFLFSNIGEISKDDLIEIYPELFITQIPEEVNQTLFYKNNLNNNFFREGFFIKKINQKWILEYITK